ncbi:MAG: hypothetical protein MUE95_01075 [Cyclobacteriaceae bacterium]|nr:hypothetical protein [Cyclobacteriaceae bacterium]
MKFENTNPLMLRVSKHLFACLVLVATMLLMSCGEDPEPANEEELITTMRVTLVPQGGGTTVTMEFKDLDGVGANPPVFTYSPSTGGATPAALLAANKIYNASIVLLNETESPAEDITEEIEEEADEHLFCFTPAMSGGATLNIQYADKESDFITGGGNRVVGIKSTWSTGNAGSGNVTIVLRHQPGTKTGACPGTGETDIEVTFALVIQ